MTGVQTCALPICNGALRGVDLAAVARSVEGALSGALGAATGEKASTDFAELGGTFTIANGVLHNSDFRMLNPFVRLSGDGDVNLGQRTIDFHVEPRAVTSREGQGGKADAGGIGVPFHVSGAWDNLHYQLDTKRLVSGVVDQIVNGKGGGIGGLLGNLLGGKNKTNPAGSNTPQNNDGKKKKDKGLNTKDLLNGLLGR